MSPKELSEYLEVRGYATAADWVYGHAIAPGAWSRHALMSITELRYVHELAMTPVWDVSPHPQATQREGPGSFREHDIQPFPGGMTPPPWTEVHAHLSSWLSDARQLTDVDAPALPETLAALHARFEQIHPFLDGNGRAGRLVLNLVLVRLGYPPAIIYKGDRSRYLRALRRADEGDPDRSASSSPVRSSTTCTSSSCPQSPGPPGLCRSPHSQLPKFPPTRCASPRSVDASRLRRHATEPGAAHVDGSTSTSRPDTDEPD